MTTSLILIYLIYIYIYTYVCIYVYRQILMHSHWYLLLSLLHIKINFTLVFTSLIRVYKAVNQVFNIILTLETWILVVISFSIVLVIIELTNLMKCFALLLINLKLERFFCYIHFKLEYIFYTLFLWNSTHKPSFTKWISVWFLHKRWTRI